jgi:hypothetical protein
MGGWLGRFARPMPEHSQLDVLPPGTAVARSPHPPSDGGGGRAHFPLEAQS